MRRAAGEAFRVMTMEANGFIEKMVEEEVQRLISLGLVRKIKKGDGSDGVRGCETVS